MMIRVCALEPTSDSMSVARIQFKGISRSIAIMKLVFRSNSALKLRLFCPPIDPSNELKPSKSESPPEKTWTSISWPIPLKSSVS